MPTYTLNLGGGVGLAAGSTLMKTTNSGANWFQIPAMGSGNFGGVTSVWPPYYWYVRSDNKIYFTSNSGSNWVVHYTAPSGNYKYLFGSMIPWGIGILALRDNGGISIYISLVGITPVSTEIPQQFKLEQNYPNPFNPVTKIKFDIPPAIQSKGLSRALGILLQVFNLLGREVSTLVNEELKPGTYEVDWNAVNYPSGVYYYKLTIGEFSETKKAVLIK